MTLNATSVKVQYNGNGSTISFPVTFIFWDLDDLEVILTQDSTGVETPWTRGTQYDVTGGDGATGTVTVKIIPVDYTPQVGQTLTIRSNRPDTQGTSFPAGGPFPSTSVEQRFDQTIRAIQQKEEVLGRTMKFAKSEKAASIGEVPALDLRKGKYLGFDGTGKPIAVAGTAVDADVSTKTVLSTGSTTARTLAVRGADRFNVLDHGIKMDGTTDDTAAWQTFLSKISNGDTIIIPNTKATSRITGTLTLTKDHVKIIGPGIGVAGTSRLEFRTMGNTDCLVLNGFGYQIEDLQIWNPDSTSRNGLTIQRAGLTTLSNLLRGVMCNQHGNHGIFIRSPQLTTLIGCRAQDNGGRGIFLDADPLDAGTNTNLINCWAQSNTGVGIYALSVTGLGIHGGQISNNGSWGIFLEQCTTVDVGGGIDAEDSKKGFLIADGVSQTVHVGKVFISLVEAGQTAILFSATKGVCTVDGVEFSNITGNHIDASGAVERLEILSTTDRGLSNTRALRFGVMSSAANVYFPRIPPLQINFVNASVAAGSPTIVNQQFIGIPPGLYYNVEQLGLETDDTAGNMTLRVFDQTGGITADSLVSNANGHGYSEPALFFKNTGPRQLIVQSLNNDAGNPHRLHGTVVIKLVPFTT